MNRKGTSQEGAMTVPDPAANGSAIYNIGLTRLNGADDHMANYRGDVLFIVNVASQCGRTPQYADLQRLQTLYSERGFSVLGFPCNQFGDEEPGGPAEIQQFCTANYGVTFPMFAKTDVNGPKRHPLYALLTETPFADGQRGDITWNFEKFLVSRDGASVRRFLYTTVPSDPEVIAAIEAAL
jgi:glutathione peroxidase